jgi:hypothetical protein
MHVLMAGNIKKAVVFWNVISVGWQSGTNTSKQSIVSNFRTENTDCMLL